MTKMFTKYKDGDKVLIDVEPSIQHGIGFRRFFGRTGTVKGIQGKAYKVEIKDGVKKKIILLTSIHLRRI
jgi:large subunit ribosomal protein L21e